MKVEIARKIPDKWSIFQQAMLDFRRVHDDTSLGGYMESNVEMSLMNNSDLHTEHIFLCTMMIDGKPMIPGVTSIKRGSEQCAG